MCLRASRPQVAAVLRQLMHQATSGIRGHACHKCHCCRCSYFTRPAAVLQRQLENGIWILDLPLQSGVCGVTAASPDAWQQLQHVEVIASLRRRTGAGFVLRGSPLQQHQLQQQQALQGLYVRVVGEDQETLYRGAVAACELISVFWGHTPQVCGFSATLALGLRPFTPSLFLRIFQGAV